MAQEGRDILKEYFEKGDFPTEAQFADLIDSCLNLVDDPSPSTVLFVISAAASDVDSDLAIGTNNAVFFAPYDMTLTEVFAGVDVAPVGSTFIVDLNKNGTTILSTKISIDASENTSLTAATPPVISSASITKGDKLNVDIDQVGATTAGKALTVYLKGTLT